MKTIPALILLLALWFTACKSPERTAYQATAVTIATVDTAMKAWGDYVRAGKATPAQEAQVRKAYSVYTQSFMAAAAAMERYWDDPTRYDSDLASALAVLGAVSAEVVKLITSFTTLAPPPPQ